MCIILFYPRDIFTVLKMLFVVLIALCASFSNFTGYAHGSNINLRQKNKKAEQNYGQIKYRVT